MMGTIGYFFNCLLIPQEDRKTLPVYPYREELLKAVNDHQVGFLWHHTAIHLNLLGKIMNC